MGSTFTANKLQLGRSKERQAQMSELLNKWILRRDKSLLTDQLPGKDDNVVFCKLSPLQTRAYERFLAMPELQLMIRAYETCDCGSGEQRSKCCHQTVEGGYIYDHYHPNGPCENNKCPWCMCMPCLSKLLSLGNHLALLKPKEHDSPMQQAFDRSLYDQLVRGDGAYRDDDIHVQDLRVLLPGG